GWTSVIVSIWLVGGILLFSIGVVGLYLDRVFREVKRRPRAIVRQVHNLAPRPGDCREPIKNSPQAEDS
ncbi:MAG: glycosyltransferase, partial [Deltaproteobacteria bacterium]|nr:glycosyltransferase [Deltaproteobacteria bacterium]